MEPTASSVPSGDAPVPIERLLAHREWVRALARRLVADPQAADDLEQRTWVAALRSPPSDERKAKAWLGTVLRNLFRERHRRDTRRRRREEAAARPETAGGARPDEVVARAEVQQRVVMAVLALDEPYRTTVLLRFFDGLPPRDVAARMEVPVETVRTRTRRALQRLREHLDEEHGGDGRTWALALLPLLRDPGPAGTPAAPAPTEGASMTPSLPLAWIVPGAAALIAGTAWMTGLVGGDPAPDEGRDVAVAPVTTAGDARPAAPAAEPAASGDAASETAGDDEPKPEAPAPVFGELALRSIVEPMTAAHGEPLRLTAAFSGTGPGETFLHEPLTADHTNWPRWIFTAEDGTRWVPVDQAVQIHLEDGFVGLVHRIAAGATHEHVRTVGRFTPLEPDTGAADGWDTGVPLPPGRYLVSLEHEKEDDTVAWSGTENGSPTWERRPVEGLWHGRVRAPEIAVVVESEGLPTLRLDLPAMLYSRHEAELTVTLSNPSRDPFRHTGTLELRLGQKGGPVATAHLAPDGFGGLVLAEPGATGEWSLEPGVTREFPIPLEKLELVSRPPWGGGEPRTVTLRDLETPARLLVQARLTRPDEDPHDEAAAPRVHHHRWALLASAPDRTADGLVLRVAPVDRSATGAPAFVAILRNDGPRTLRVPRGLRPGRELRLRLGQVVAGGPGGPPVLGPGAVRKVPGWKGPPTAADPGVDDFVELAPGTEIRRGFDLGELLDGPLPEGVDLVLQAEWLNLEDGRGLGLAPGTLTDGRVEAKAVELR